MYKKKDDQTIISYVAIMNHNNSKEKPLENVLSHHGKINALQFFFNEKEPNSISRQQQVLKVL